jgi:hypothetical protein
VGRRRHPARDHRHRSFFRSGRLWKVRAVLAHWVETGPWWQTPPVRAVAGVEPDGAPAPARTPLGELITERELWRVEAGRGRPELAPSGPADPADPDAPGVSGVFDLSFDWSDGRWTLVGCVD